MSVVGQDEGYSTLTDMQRKYRIMETNRKNYSEDSQAMIKRQRETIDKFKAENEVLKKELALSKGDGALTLTIQKQMIKHQDNVDVFLRKIELERRRLDELEKAIALADSKIISSRTSLGGVNAAKEEGYQASKQIRVLESRVDKAITKFNESISKNKELRHEIDNLRRERSNFDEIFARTQKELHEKKKEIANVIEISNIAYEARDQCQNEIAALRAQGDKELYAWNGEMKEVQKLIDAEKKHAQDLRAVQSVGGLTIEQENELKSKVHRGKWGSGKAMAMAHTSTKTAVSYDELVAKIQAATGITEMDELVMSFTKAEDKNYSLFNFANELNQDIERLEEIVLHLQEEETRLAGEDRSSDSMRQDKLKILEAKLASIEAKTASFQEKEKAGQSTINALKAGVSSIFTKVGCDTPANRALLDEGEGITETNMVQVLGIIEGRGNEVMQVFGKAEEMTPPPAPAPVAEGGEEGEEAPAPAPAPEPALATTLGSPLGLSQKILGTGPLVPTGGSIVQISAPTTTEDNFDSENESDEDLDDRPLTRAELEAKTQRTISKRDSRVARRQRKK